MTTKVASLIAEIGADTKGFEKGAASVVGGLGKLAISAGVVTSAFSLMERSWDAAVEGARLQRLTDSGAEMARQFGGDMDTIIAKVKEASLGTVSEMDIISASNRAMLLGLSADADKLANLMEIAAFRGRAMGLDTTKAFNDIVTGIGRASPLILDNLGIVINSKEIYSNYAESIGKTVRELTKAEKTQALLNGVLDDGNRMLDNAGGLIDDNAAKYERLTADVKNFQDAVKITWSAGLTNFIYGNNEALEKVIETNKKMSVGNYEQAQQLKAVYEAQVGSNHAIEAGASARLRAIEDSYEYAKSQIEVQEALLARTTADAEVTKYNEDYISTVAEITGRQRDYNKDMISMSEERREIEEKMLSDMKDGWWEGSDRIQGYKDKLAELDIKMQETATAQEEASQRMILSMLQQGLAADGLSTAEMQYLLQTGLQWGIYSQSAVDSADAALRKAQELADQFNNMPTDHYMTIHIASDGLSNLGASLAKQSEANPSRSYMIGGRAGGGAVDAGQMYMVGESGRELFVPSQNGNIVSNNRLQSSDSTAQMMARLAMSIPTAQDNAKALGRELMKLGIGVSR